MEDNSEISSSYTRNTLEDAPSIESKCLFQDPDEDELSRLANIAHDFRVSGKRFNETVIDVYFHAIQPFPFIAHLTKDIIEKQIQVLNEAFSGEGNTLYPNDCFGNPIDHQNNTNTSTGISFRLVKIKRTYNPIWFFFPNRFQLNMRESLHVGDCSTLNIYSVFYLLGLGIGSSPLSCLEEPRQDGVTIDLRTLPGGVVSNGEYDEGDTVVHEVGHWLGLVHTFQGGCKGEDHDNLMDTPREQSPAYACPIGRDTCGGGGEDPIHNFMDYSDDCCMYEFTPDQISVMQAVVAFRLNTSKEND